MSRKFIEISEFFFSEHPPHNLDPSNMFLIEANFSLCISLFHAWKLLNTYGLESFKNNILQLQDESIKAGKKTKSDFFKNPAWQELLNALQQVVTDQVSY